jgi:hypothetical protein
MKAGGNAMRATRNTKAALTMALLLAGELAGVGRSAAAGSPKANPVITIHVRNYANVDEKTLEEAENVATRIFRKAGVDIGWADIDVTPECRQVKSLAEKVYTLSDIQLSIFPRETSGRSDIPANAMGLAPGSGVDRQLVYVLYNRVEAVSRRQLEAVMKGKIDVRASKSEILGHAIAHELGHVLLNLGIHSNTGIMRGGWDQKDFTDIAFGSLGFTSQQGEVMRAEVLRRNIVRRAPASVRIESPESMP